MRHSFYRPRRGRSLKRILTDAAMMLLVAIAVLYFGDLAGPPGLHVGVSVIDGDSIRDGERRIRLYGIDAPKFDSNAATARAERIDAATPRARLSKASSERKRSPARSSTPTNTDGMWRAAKPVRCRLIMKWCGRAGLSPTTAIVSSI